jgi:hypothetical protein
VAYAVGTLLANNAGEIERMKLFISGYGDSLA